MGGLVGPGGVVGRYVGIWESREVRTRFSRIAGLSAPTISF